MPTIFKRNKTWYLNYRHQGRQVRKAIGPDRSLAKIALAKIEEQINYQRAGIVPPSKVSVNGLSVDNFHRQLTAHILARKTQRTAETYIRHFDNFLKFLKLSGVLDLGAIDVTLINNFISHRLQNDTHPNTVNHEIDSMRTIFNIAIDLQLVQSNPFLKLKSIRPKKIKRPPHYFSSQEIDLLFRHITPRFQPFFNTLLHTGVRSGEFRLFEWQDFDIKNRIVHVRTKKDSEVKMRSRNIPMHQKVLDAYWERKRANENDHYVFTTKEGKLFDTQMIRKIFQRFLKKAGIARGNVHTLRHTFASHLVSHSGDIYYVSELLGHTSVKQTEIYAHLLPNKDYHYIDKFLQF